ncbi:hypothetical protein SAMN05192532_103300 [Alteribacillus iranensis]|uniref:Uncharacterized protein n=1 Tax=Alteribacillus iranensis TaxID=930128 RepID=A0A1I2CZ98_9BACI|nr:hypothetical protein SAMN05192532_103300 [Alteribacillus iranensis]
MPRLDKDLKEGSIVRNKEKQKRKKKREVLKELLRKNLKDWNKLPKPEGRGTPTSSSKPPA